MASVPQVVDAIQADLLELPAWLARETGYCQRQSKLTAERFVQTVVLGWLHQPNATLAALTQMAHRRGITITPQGLDQRFDAASARLLAAVLGRALGTTVAGNPAGAGVLARFAGVFLIDSTTITLPDSLGDLWRGCGGRLAEGVQAALKCTVRCDLRQGGVVEVELNDGRTQDRATALQHAPVPKGALRIADQGFWSLSVLRQIATTGGYFLGRHHSQTTVFVDGERVDLAAWLARQPAPVLDVPVELGIEERLPVRLLAIRVPQAVADQRRRRLKASARSGGHGVPKQTRALADWTLLVTNVPAAQATVADLEVLRRLRWQIELLFKLWKSHGKVAISRSAKPWRILCEVYAKLLAMLLQHRLLLLTAWPPGERNLVQAAATVRSAVPGLARALACRDALATVLAELVLDLSAVVKTTKRRARPSLQQLLLDPDLALHAALA